MCFIIIYVGLPLKDKDDNYFRMSSEKNECPSIQNKCGKTFMAGMYICIH